MGTKHTVPQRETMNDNFARCVPAGHNLGWTFVSFMTIRARRGTGPVPTGDGRIPQMLRKTRYRERNFSPCHSENADPQGTVHLKDSNIPELPSEPGLLFGGFGVEDLGRKKQWKIRIGQRQPQIPT
jgi:hypothetical protein